LSLLARWQPLTDTSYPLPWLDHTPGMASHGFPIRPLPTRHPWAKRWFFVRRKTRFGPPPCVGVSSVSLSGWPILNPPCRLAIRGTWSPIEDGCSRPPCPPPSSAFFFSRIFQTLPVACLRRAPTPTPKAVYRLFSCSANACKRPLSL